MNFFSDSVKLNSKPQNDDFYFDIDTPRGHFYAILDLAPHDYANLNATLNGKFESIVGSLVSPTRFSADLFLGLLAKEINNFLHSLGKQSGGPDLLGSGALCLLNGNRLVYLICGHVKVRILSGNRLIQMNDGKTGGAELAADKPASDEQAGNASEQLGAAHMDAPLTERVQQFTLQDDDLIVITTSGVESAFERPALTKKLVGLRSSEPKLISDALMKASASSRDDRTVLVINGPYEPYVDPLLEDLSKAVDYIEAKMNAIEENDGRRSLSDDRWEKMLDSQTLKLEQRFDQQIEVLKDRLQGKAASSDIGELAEKLEKSIATFKDESRGKATSIDLLELDEKLKNLSVVLSSKADTAEVLGLQRDVLKLGLVANNAASAKATTESTPAPVPVEDSVAAPDANSSEFDEEAGFEPETLHETEWSKSFVRNAALLILAVAMAGAFIGAWLNSKIFNIPEVWSVKTSGNQIVIDRLDGSRSGGGVTLNVTQPLKSTGEQTFSSFADVKQYIDTIVNNDPPAQQINQTPQPQESRPQESKPAPPRVTEVAIGQGDTLDKIARRNNTTNARLKELNPQITNWRVLRVGQKIVVPATSGG